MIYRILQEIIQNIKKHASADQVIIQYLSEDFVSLHLIIEDDGRGCDYGVIVQGPGLKSIWSWVDTLRCELKGRFIYPKEYADHNIHIVIPKFCHNIPVLLRRH